MLWLPSEESVQRLNTHGQELKDPRRLQDSWRSAAEAGESKAVAERGGSLQSADTAEGLAGQAGNGTVVRAVGRP